MEVVFKMSERYLITGVQLGMLKYLDKESKEKLIDEIIEKQFIGNSCNHILVDVDKLYYKNE